MGGEVAGGGQEDIDKKIHQDMKNELKKILNNRIYLNKEVMISDLFSHFLSRRNLLLERKLGLGKNKLFDHTPLLKGGGVLDQYETDDRENDDKEDNDFLQQPETSAANSQNYSLQRNLPNNNSSEISKRKDKVSAKDMTKRRESEPIKVSLLDINAKKIRNIERKIKLVLKLSKCSLIALAENCNKAISFFKKSYYRKFFIIRGSNIVDTSTKIKFDSMKILASVSLNRNEIFSILTLKANGGKVKIYSQVEKEFLKKFCKLLEITNITCHQIKTICK